MVKKMKIKPFELPKPKPRFTEAQIQKQKKYDDKQAELGLDVPDFSQPYIGDLNYAKKKSTNNNGDNKKRK